MRSCCSGYTCGGFFLTNAHLSDLEAIEWIYKVPQAVLLLCNLVFLVWIMAVSLCGVLCTGMSDR